MKVHSKSFIAEKASEWAAYLPRSVRLPHNQQNRCHVDDFRKSNLLIIRVVVKTYYLYAHDGAGSLDLMSLLDAKIVSSNFISASIVSTFWCS